MTSDMSQYYDALRKADAAGDSAAATKLTSYIQKQLKQSQTAAPVATPTPTPPNISTASRYLQKAGDIAGGIQDFATKTAATGIFGPGLEKGLELVGGQVAQDVGKTKPVQMAAGLYGDLKTAHPELVGDLEAAGKIASLVPVGGLAAKVGGKAAGEAIGGAVDTFKTANAARDLEGLRGAAEDIGKQAEESFGKAYSAGHALQPEQASGLLEKLDKVANIETKGGKASETQTALYQPYLKAVANFKTDADNGLLSLQNLHALRRSLGNVAFENKSPDIRRAAGAAKGHIDDLMDDIRKTADPRQAGFSDLASGIDKYSQAKTIEKIADVVENSGGSGKKLAAGVDKLLSNRKASASLSEEQKDLLRGAAKEGTLSKIMPQLIHLGTGHNYGLAVSKFLPKLGASTGQRAAIEKTVRSIENPAPERIVSRQIQPQPQPPQALLPSPGNMSRLPMTDQQITQAQAKMGAMGRPHPETPAVMYIRQQALTAAMRRALLSGDLESARQIQAQLQQTLR